MRKKKRNHLGVKNEKVHVLVRIKPLGAGGGGGESEAKMKGCKSSIKFTDNNLQCGEKKYNFPSRVIQPGDGQVETFQYVIGDLVELFLQGVNVNTIAYGQTGSGKTHTLLGKSDSVSKYFDLRKKFAKKKRKRTKVKKEENENEECEGEEEENEEDSITVRKLLEYGKDLGVLPRAAKEILKRIDEKKKNGIKCSLTGTMVEIHLMEVYDILNNKKPVGFEKNECMLKGEVEWEVENEDDMMNFLSMSERRTSGKTLMNDTSSRSHLVVTLYYCEHNEETGKVRTSKFTVVDLGGSERAHEAHGKDVMVTKDWSALEGLCINFSLFILLWCVESFSKNKRKTITRNRAKRMKEFVFELNTYWFGLQLPCLIWGSFVGTSTTRIFINVSQAPKNTFQSNYALEFGRKASFLKMKPTKNERYPYKKLLGTVRKKLRENKAQLKRLKKINRNQKYIKKRSNEVTLLQNQLRRLLKVK